MAKWIYEKWQPKWPEPNGITTTYARSETLRIFEFNGSYVESKSADPGSMIFSTSRNTYGIKDESERGIVQYDPPDIFPSPVKDYLLDTFIAEDGSYPDNGVSVDNFYYVKIKLAFPTMRILRDGQWAEVETGFVLKDGVWKPIEEIYKLQDGQWVQA